MYMCEWVRQVRVLFCFVLFFQLVIGAGAEEADQAEEEDAGC